MSRTYRSRHKHTHAISKDEYMKDTWFSRWDNCPKPLHDDGSWDKYKRDGHWSNGRCKEYRDCTNKIIRHKNRKDIHLIKSDPENYDNISFATQWDGKKLIWAIW